MMISPTMKFVLAFLSAYSFAAVSSASSYTSDPLSSYEKVRVHRCDEENQRIPSVIDEPLELLEDGLLIRLCFESTPQASFNDVSILKVDEFQFTKIRTPGDLAAAGPTRQIPAIIRQKTVDHGVVISDDISTLSCDPGSEICAFETTLTGYFFLTEGTIHGKGKVLMQRGTEGGRRQLQHIDTFEDVIIDFDFVGENGGKLPPKQRITIGIIVSVGTLLCFCCCAIFACCGLRICCFDNRGRKKKDIDDDDYDDDYDVDDVEAVPVMMNWMSKPSKRSSKSKKDDVSMDEDEEISETHSLDEDEFWVESGSEDYEMTNSLEEGNLDRKEDNYKKEKVSVKTKAAVKTSKKKSRSIIEKTIEEEENFDGEEDYAKTKVVRKSTPSKSPRKKKTITKAGKEDRKEDNAEGKVITKTASPKSPKKKKTTMKTGNLDRNEDNAETKVVRKKKKSRSITEKKHRESSIGEEGR
jgi:hypothetical protein